MTLSNKRITKALIRQPAQKACCWQTLEDRFSRIEAHIMLLLCHKVLALYYRWKGAQLHSDRVLDIRLTGHMVMVVSKTLYPLLRLVLIQPRKLFLTWLKNC